MTECKPEQFQFHRIGNREVVAQFDGGDITTDAGGLLLREVEQRTGIIGKFAACFRSLRPGEQEGGFVRERWVPINRLTRRCRPTSGAHRLPLSTRSALRRSRMSARIVRTLWDLSEQSFALSLNIAEVSRIPECSRSILYATT